MQNCYQILADARLIAKTAEPAEVMADALPPLPDMELPPGTVPQARHFRRCLAGVGKRARIN